MATLEAFERLQKFDWLIQKLHSLRSSLQSDQGLQDLHKLHALQLLAKSDFQLNGTSSSVGESEDEKMEMCRTELADQDHEELEEELEEDILDEEYIKEEDDEEEVLEDEEMEEQTIPLALTTSTPNKAEEAGQKSAATASPADGEASGEGADRSRTRRDEDAADTDPHNDAEHAKKNGFSPPPPQSARFPTGLFPPLPFEAMFPLLGEDEIKVGTTFYTSFIQSFNNPYWKIRPCILIFIIIFSSINP